MEPVPFSDPEVFDQWVNFYFRESEVEPTPEFFEQDTIPANVEKDQWLTQIVISFTGDSPLSTNKLLPVPTWTARQGDRKVWGYVLRLPVVASEESKSRNKYQMAQADLQWVFKGTSPLEIPNPWLDEDGSGWTGTTHTLNTLETELRKAGEWKNTLSLDKATKGGRMTSDAKKISSAKNAEAARAALLAKGEKTAKKILGWVDEGKTYQEIADLMGISVTSVPSRISLARKRLSND